MFPIVLLTLAFSLAAVAVVGAIAFIEVAFSSGPPAAVPLAKSNSASPDAAECKPLDRAELTA